MNLSSQLSKAVADLNKIKSICRFKAQLISELPYVPNNKESKDYLMLLDIGDIVHFYDFWQQRLISTKPRETIVSSKVRNSRSYVRNRDKIKVILSSVKRGLKLDKYLSHKAHQATFNVEEFKKTCSFNSFRDQLLICEGFYHLHLEEFPARTNEVLIVHVTSNSFEVVQVAEHSLFEDNAEAFTEYGKYVDAFLSSKVPRGGYYLGGAGGGMQNTAGSAIDSSFHQVRIRKILQNVEITNGGIENYVKCLYRSIHDREPQYIKPEWRMQSRELFIYDKKNEQRFESKSLLSQYADRMD